MHIFKSEYIRTPTGDDIERKDLELRNVRSSDVQNRTVLDTQEEKHHLGLRPWWTQTRNMSFVMLLIFLISIGIIG
ncbi:unnamed protein product, partial [Adineta steineri]